MAGRKNKTYRSRTSFSKRDGYTILPLRRKLIEYRINNPHITQKQLQAWYKEQIGFDIIRPRISKAFSKQCISATLVEFLGSIQEEKPAEENKDSGFQLFALEDHTKDNFAVTAEDNFKDTIEDDIKDKIERKIENNVESNVEED